MNNENYINIQGWMINNLKLKGNELILYAIIYGFSQDGHSEYFGSQRYISKAMQISLPTANSLINKLLNKKLIIKKSESHYQAVKETLTESVKETLTESVKETLTNNNNTNYNTNNNIYIEILNFWNSKEITKHKKISNITKKKINILLKEFNLEEIKNSIKNYAEIYHSTETYWDHKWTLEEFLSRANGMRVFLYKNIKDYKKTEIKNKKPVIEALKVDENKYKDVLEPLQY